MLVLMTATSFLPAGLSMVPFWGAGAGDGGAPGAGVVPGEPLGSASPTPSTAHAVMSNGFIVDPPRGLVKPLRSQEPRGSSRWTRPPQPGTPAPSARTRHRP